LRAESEIFAAEPKIQQPLPEISVVQSVTEMQKDFENKIANEAQILSK